MRDLLKTFASNPGSLGLNGGDSVLSSGDDVIFSKLRSNSSTSSNDLFSVFPYEESKCGFVPSYYIRGLIGLVLSGLFCVSNKRELVLENGFGGLAMSRL